MISLISAEQTFVAPANDFYFFNLNAGFLGGESGNLRMEPTVGNHGMMNVRRWSSSHNDVDAGSRDGIYNMAAGDAFKTTQVIFNFVSSTKCL